MVKVLSIPMLTEPVPISDDFVQGIAEIEQVGCCVRFVLYSDQRVWEAGSNSRVIVRKIILPIDALPHAIKQATDFLALRTIEAVGNVFRLR